MRVALLAFRGGAFTRAAAMFCKACLANDTNLALASKYDVKSYRHEAKSIRHEARNFRHKAKSYRHEIKSIGHEARSYRYEAKSLRYEGKSFRWEAKSLGTDIGIKKAKATSLGTSAFFTVECAAMFGSREGGLSVCF